MKKYYTPKEEEITVGFNCVYTTLTNGFSEDSFLKPYNTYEDDIADCTEEGLESYDIKMLIELFDTMENVCNQIRVKYLDKEDIESLGFKKWVDRENYDLGEYQLHKNNNFNVTIYDGDANLIFTGDIKNKSELKKLLKKLNIKK